MQLLLDFFTRESVEPKRPILIMGMISGLANSFILASINSAATSLSDGSFELEIQLFFIYFISVLLFVYSRKFSLARATIAVEDAVNRVRVRIADKIRSSELGFIEEVGKTDIYTYLTQDTNLISQSALIIIAALQSMIVLAFCLLYIAWLSPLGFLLTLSALSATLLVYFIHYQGMTSELQRTTQKEAEFFSSLDHILDGFKEVKINQNKSDDIFAQIKHISAQTERLKVSVGLKFVVDLMFSRVFSNLLLGLIVFILPLFTVIDAPTVVKITATALFIIGPIESIVGAIPVFLRANVAVANIRHLERQLDTASHLSPTRDDAEPRAPMREFRRLRLDRVEFQYVDREGRGSFNTGPLSLEIQQGEILFIVGGNGSGKSTLLKLFVGLYYPQRGHLSLDNTLIDDYNYPAYRELFSIVFTDFHLFERLYGLREVDPEKVNTLLRTLELEQKTRYVNGAFSHLNLSTGQKKRLAFAAAVLEDKPVYIFDELAADQDPQFRQYFYEVLLPALRVSGKTIIAVTHDDKYFYTADRVVKMEYGNITSIESTRGPSPD